MYSQEEIDKIHVLYIHGFEGSGNGPSSQLLQKVLGDEYYVMAPKLDLLDFEWTIDKIKLFAFAADFIVASSFGCFYAMMIKDKNKILINPALPNDLVRNSLIDNADELNTKLDEFLKVPLSLQDKDETYFAFGLQDDLVNNKDWAKEYYSEARIFTCDMGHKLDKEGARLVLSIINFIKGGLKIQKNNADSKSLTDEQIMKVINEKREVLDWLADK